MRIEDFIWLPDIVEKLAVKHHVTIEEVEEVFFNRPRFRFVESGHRPDEDVYAAGGQSDSGRYLVVFFVHKQKARALILSARDADPKERRRYEPAKTPPLTTISKARTLAEIGEYWDSHSLADVWEQTEEADFEVRAQRRRRVTLAPEVYDRIETQAHTQGISAETLVNLWLAERLRA